MINIIIQLKLRKIIKYEWDFSYESGDGFQSEEETQTPETEHDFTEGGVYWIYLKSSISSFLIFLSNFRRLI